MTDQSQNPLSPKQRMLRAYRGIAQDRPPVAPEFWAYYPAKVLGVDMIEFEKLPFWQAMQTCFRRFDCDGWAGAWVGQVHPDVREQTQVERISDTQFRQTTLTRFGDRQFTSVRLLDKNEPSSQVEYPVKEPADLPAFVRRMTSPKIALDFTDANAAYTGVGEDYLLELGIGFPFTDLLCYAMGFEDAVMHLLTCEPESIQPLYEMYLQHTLRLVEQAAKHTAYESFFIGCSSSCNSLVGPKLWRQYDLPWLAAVVKAVHAQGRLVHHHLHGRVMETVGDLPGIGFDCVCPFERPPGGDVVGREGLAKVRDLLDGKVTMNGNVHTVETLIRGTPEDVRREVRQIREVFAGNPRVIIGTGDQVGRETPEENLLAMIDEAKR